MYQQHQQPAMNVTMTAQQPYGQQYSSQPGYGQPQAGYSQPGYGHPQPGYAQPQMSYNQPQPGYAQPYSGYGQSQMIYNQPQPAYIQPQSGYAQPQPGYGHPQPGYSQPQQPQVIAVKPQPAYQQPPPQPSYGQPPMGYAQPGYPPAQPIYVVAQKPMKKGYERLTERDGIFIKQKFELLEMFTGCETENTYYVYPLGKDGDKKGRKLFKCKEKSDFCARQCMNGDCRPFVLHVKLDDDNEALDEEPFLHIDRPCKCTFYCCNRPEITVNYVEDGKNDYIGKIVDEFNCCDITLSLFDKDQNIKYKIVADCCQCGLHCKGPCDSCENIVFELKTPSGETVANINKKSPGCVAAMVTDMDNFAVQFPTGSSKEDRALIMSAVLFLDFRYFEERPQDRNQNRGFY